MLSKEILAALSAPYEESVIKTMKGVYGDDIRYVPAHVVQKRLNDVLEGRWSFIVQGYEIAGDECLVLGALTIEGITKQQYGGAKITKGEDGAIKSLSTDIKAGAADSLKRCSAGFGVLDSLITDSDKKPAEKKQPEKKEENKSKSNGNGGNGNASNGNDSGSITLAQTNACLAIARKIHMSNAGLSKLIKAEFDLPRLEVASKRQASDLIKKLGAMVQQQAA